VEVKLVFVTQLHGICATLSILITYGMHLCKFTTPRISHHLQGLVFYSAFINGCTNRPYLLSFVA